MVKRLVHIDFRISENGLLRVQLAALWINTRCFDSAISIFALTSSANTMSYSHSEAVTRCPHGAYGLITEVVNTFKALFLLRA